MRMGVDLGGTKTEAIGMDSYGEVRGRIRVRTPEDYDAIIASVGRLLDKLELKIGRIEHVGVGTPGAIDPSTGRIKNAYNTALQNRAFDRDLERALDRPVRVANDSNCFALSEATDGAGAEARIVFGVILGTGVGGGVVVGGQILAGANAIAGEWGHNPLPWPHDDELPGPKCTCGRNGCIEAFCSGPALERAYERTANMALPAAQIAEHAEAGDDLAIKALERYGDRLARSLASVINVLDPDVIVLGGGVSQIPALYRIVTERWGELVFSDSVTTKLLPNRFGDSSGVRGAAWLWPGKIAPG